MAQRNRKGKDDKPSERIGRLDNHTIGYYRRVSNSLTEDCQNDDDKRLLLENVFQQLTTEALAVSRNQTVSTIVESLLQQATGSQLHGFMAAMGQDWETAIQDRFASHVCQTLLLCVAPHMNSEGTDQESDAESVLQHFMKLYRILIGNVALFMQHTYASHILRVIMEVLAGKRVADDVIKSKIARRHNKGATEKPKMSSLQPTEFPTLLQDLTQKITGLKMLKDHAEHFLSNPVLQTALLVTKATDEGATSDMCRRVMMNIQLCDEEASLPSVVTSEIGSWLIEQLLHVAPDDIYSDITELPMCQEELIHQMADHNIANFVLQALIAESRTKAQFQHFYKILMPLLERILAHNHMGIVQKLAEGCLKYGTKQKKILKALMEAFHCQAPVERQIKFVTLLAGLRTYEIFYKVKEDSDGSSSDSDDEGEEPQLPQLREISLHGSLLLQTLLKFANPHALVVSMLDLRPGELRNLACDPKGSHIVEAFLASPTIGEKTKGQFINKFKGFFTDLSCDKNGSRAVEKIWESSNLQSRTVIAEEMSKHGDRLQGDRFGRFVWRSCALHHFKTRRSDWQSIQTGDVKKRQLFKDLLEDGPATKKVKKQNSSVSQENDTSNLLLQDSSDVAEEQSSKKHEKSHKNAKQKSKKKKQTAVD